MKADIMGLSLERIDSWSVTNLDVCFAGAFNRGILCLGEEMV